MKDKSFYYSLWLKYQQVLAMQMKNAVNGPKEIKMLKNEFAALGKRPLSDYMFELHIDNGQVANNINGKAIARDLLDVLGQNTNSLTLLSNHHYVFSMGKDLVLKISVLPPAQQSEL